MDNKKITFHTTIKKTASNQPIETMWCVFASDYNSVQVEFVVDDLRPDEIRTVNPTIILNMDDGSMVQRTKEQIVQKNNVFSYKLKDNEGKHTGVVKAQLKLATVTGETYMSNIYTFTILESLDSVPVPKEFVIDDIQNILQEVKHHITLVFKDEIERERVFKDYVANIQLSEKQREMWFNQSQQTRASLFQVFMDEAGEVLKDAQQVKDLFDELVDKGIIESNINEKLADLEESYAPRLSTLEQNNVSLTAQLQQKATKGDIGLVDLDKNKTQFDETWFADSVKQQWGGNTPVNATPPDGGVTTVKLAPKAVTDRKTDFLVKVEQYIDRANAEENAYWYFSGDVGSTVGKTTDATGLWAYDKVFVPAGQTVSITSARLFFSGSTDLNGKKITQFSADDVTGDVEYTPSADCYVHVTAQSTIPKLINLPLSKISTQMRVASKGTIDVLLYGKSIDNREYIKNEITVNNGIELVNAIKNITDSSEQKQYTIKLNEGSYYLYSALGGKAYLTQVDTEMLGEMYGVLLPDYVHLKGNGKVEVILVIPDADATAESTKRISVLNLLKNNTIEDITFIGQNVRYVVHDETGNGFHNLTRRIKNCHFKHLGNRADLWQSTQAYAIGTGSGGSYEFDNVIFESVKSAFSAHDNANQAANSFKFNNCKTITGSDYSIRFGTYGTGSELHQVILNNCNIDKYIYVMEEAPGSLTGMRFKLRGSGNTVAPYYTVNSAGARLPIAFADETTLFTNVGTTTISKGTPVKLTDIGKGTTIATGEEHLFYGIALEDIEPDGKGVVKYRGFISRDDTPFASLTVGAKIGIVNGALAKDVTGEYIGVVTHWRNILLK